MSDDDVHIPPHGDDPHGPIPFPTPGRGRPWRKAPAQPRSRWAKRRARRRNRPPKPRLRKLRLLLILVGLGTLAFVSTVFGMMMAVASDIPQIENRQQYNNEANSYLYDDHWRPIGIFAPPNNVVIDQYNDISSPMQEAIVSIEDRRFWTNPGVDIRGIARAFIADVTGGATQGASTITEEFVKNALAEQNNRTVFEKLREAALAYHLTRKWQKTKILTEYLNSIYFGNGAYGIESAARVYFGKKYGFDSTATSQSKRQLEHRASAARLRRLYPPDRGSQVRGEADSVGCRVARRHGRLADRVRSDPPSAGREAPARPGAPGHARAARHHARPIRQVDP